MAAREALALRVSGLYGERSWELGVNAGASAVARFIQRVTWLELTVSSFDPQSSQGLVSRAISQNSQRATIVTCLHN